MDVALVPHQESQPHGLAGGGMAGETMTVHQDRADQSEKIRPALLGDGLRLLGQVLVQLMQRQEFAQSCVMREAPPGDLILGHPFCRLHEEVFSRRRGIAQGSTQPHAVLRPPTIPFAVPASPQLPPPAPLDASAGQSTDCIMDSDVA